jgi:C4-dicarboxylate-binding protein DctP
MIAPSFSNLTNISPAWLAMDLPFAFLDQKAVDEALHGDIGRRLFQTLEPHKMVGVAYWNNGFKQMTSNMRPLLMPKDFQGQTFRILPSTMIAEQFRALGARTINYPFNEVYRKLENGTVDGQENTISNIYTKRLFQVQKYMTISNHGYLGYAVIFNKPFLDDLPSELRSIIQEALNETTNWINNQSLSMQKQQFDAIRKSGTIEIHELTDSERGQWMSSMKPLYSQYAEEIGENLVNEIIEIRDRDLSLKTR